MLRRLGRADRHVKINGVRIEPSEIEAVLCADPRVTEAAVVARANADTVTLHGFVVTTEPDAPALVAALRRRLAAGLPSASRTSRLIVLDRLPTVPGGKVDLGALSHWLPQ
jgi:acyl-coenzyme A synthetase/AMP-(fatty) acid ligase